MSLGIACSLSKQGCNIMCLRKGMHWLSMLVQREDQMRNLRNPRVLWLQTRRLSHRLASRILKKIRQEVLHTWFNIGCSFLRFIVLDYVPILRLMDIFVQVGPKSSWWRSQGRAVGTCDALHLIRAHIVCFFSRVYQVEWWSEENLLHFGRYPCWVPGVDAYITISSSLWLPDLERFNGLRDGRSKLCST